MRARLVPLSEILVVIREPWVDETRKPFVTGEGAYIPVRDGYPSSHALPSRQRTGRGYQKLGDLILFHGDRPTSEELGEVSEREHPRGILWIAGHEGVIRKPVITLLQGSAGEVTHRESGITYRLDPEKVMFSQGNREEKTRIARLVRSGEEVCDMFAGIGYFTLGMARAGANVHAIEINPVSFQYLKQNIKINDLSDYVRAEQGDCRNQISGTYDRIHLGHFDAISFLPYALNHVRQGTMMHVHMLNDRSEELTAILHSSGLPADITLHRVKKAGPRIWHLVADVVIG